MLTERVLRKLYESAELSRDAPISFQTRLIFGITLSTGMRISELHLLTCSRIRFGEQDGKKVIFIRSIIGSKVGASKNARGGWRFTKEKRKEVTIFQC